MICLIVKRKLLSMIMFCKILGRYHMLSCVFSYWTFILFTSWMQLLEMSIEKLINRGKSKLSTRTDLAIEYLNKPFKLRLGQGFYGECLVCSGLDQNFNSVSMIDAVFF